MNTWSTNSLLWWCWQIKWFKTNWLLLNIQLCLTKTKLQKWIYLFSDFCHCWIWTRQFFAGMVKWYSEKSQHFFSFCYWLRTKLFMTFYDCRNVVHFLCTNTSKANRSVRPHWWARKLHWISFVSTCAMSSSETELLCSSWKKNGF